MAENTVIKRCNYCAHNNITHEFQDEKYGKFMRVHNVNDKGSANCTVCDGGNVKKK